jgi:hypothetical protein
MAIMHKHKYERFLLNLLIERTLFVYNIVLSNHFNITKKYKKKCIRLLVGIQTYFGNIRNQNYDTKDANYQYRQYKILMNRLDYLLKSFDSIDRSEEFKQIWTNKFLFYISETINHTWINPYYDKNYISDFAEFLRHISINSLLTRNSNDLIYYNKFYLL